MTTIKTAWSIKTTTEGGRVIRIHWRFAMFTEKKVEREVFEQGPTGPKHVVKGKQIQATETKVETEVIAVRDQEAMTYGAFPVEPIAIEYFETMTVAKKLQLGPKGFKAQIEGEVKKEFSQKFTK